MTTLGDVTLRPDQIATVARIHAACRSVGGALLADPPGTGKTVVALAVAASHPSVVVCAPAAVRAHWAAHAARMHVPLRFVSLEALSRGAACPAAALLIVDEAHRVRTPRTRRHRTLASACVGRTVLLLSATPVVNRLADRTALLGLFLGPQAARLTPAALGACVIRGVGDAARPAVRRGGALGRATAVPGLAAALRALPPPLPLTDGATAHALVISTLAMAWQSSLAALDAALRRRLQRGEAIRDCLAGGRRPTPTALRAWVLDGSATQLALPGLVASSEDKATPPAAWCVAAHGVVARHLDAVRALRDRITPWIDQEVSTRAAALRRRLAADPHDRGVVFAQHRATIEALYAALRTEPGVVCLTGARVRAAAGRWTRADVMAAFRRDAGPWRVDDVRGIRLLLATDVLSEGIELPAARWLVHADFPWTPARLEQRLGRIRRAGTAGTVRSDRFAAPTACTRLVRIVDRLATKARTRRDAVADATDASVVRARLLALTDATARAAAGSGRSLRGIALARTAQGERLVGVRLGTDGTWRATEDPGRLRRWLPAGHPLATPLEGRAGDSLPDATRLRADDACVREVRRRLVRSLAGAAWRTAAVGADGAPPDLVRLRRRLDRILSRSSALARPQLAARHARWIAAAGGRLESGRAARLRAALRVDDDAGFLTALTAALADAATTPTDAPRLLATLVILPDGANARADIPGPVSPDEPDEGDAARRRNPPATADV